MKTTTNQTRNFCRTNVYFKSYIELYERRLSYKQMPDGWTDYNTNFKNQLFRRAWKEFDQKFKGLRTQSGRRPSGNFSSSVRIKMSLCTWAEFAEFRYSCSMNNKGDWWIYMDYSSLIDYSGESHSRVDGKFLFTDSENPFERSLQYNGNLSIDVVDEFVKNHITKYKEKVNIVSSIKSEILQESKFLSECFDKEVNTRTQYLLLFQNSALKNQAKANELLELTEDMKDIESHSRLTKTNKETVLGKDPETVINNANVQSNDTAMQINITRDN